jgi:hypothetical protein
MLARNQCGGGLSRTQLLLVFGGLEELLRSLDRHDLADAACRLRRVAACVHEPYKPAPDPADAGRNWTMPAGMVGPRARYGLRMVA